MATIVKADMREFPNLPGYGHAPLKESYPRKVSFDIVNGQRMEIKEGLTHDKPKFVRAVKQPNEWRNGSIPESTSREVYKDCNPKDFDELPAWDALDRHVLRFYGMFKEAVVETNLENYRTRKVRIYYYLEDDTCHIIEPKTDNCGIPQGTMIRRHRFPAPGGGYIQPTDLVVGNDFHVYGRVIKITDCDAFTREYFDSLGMQQPEGVPIEMDPFTQTRSEMKAIKTAPERTYEKLYREVQLGGGHVNADMQQFMECDRKVCRFFAVYDDVLTPQYERRPFTIMYFLSDDTMEIRELYPLNCGRDNFPRSFKRGPMPRQPGLKGPLDQPRKKSDCMSLDDLSVGIQVNLLGTDYFIYDADPFTRDYYMTERGTELAPKMDVRLPERAVPRASTPPYPGYGTWDDSMGSVLHLVPQKPKKDFVKLFNNDGKILRFTCKYKHPKPEDVERRFVCSYHLFDDTVSIHEPPQRNLGIVTGKFLEKAVHLNQITGRLFEPADLLPGKTISVFNHVFEMLDMDEYTRRYAMAEDAESKIDLTAVLEKMREAMRQQFPLVRDIFRRFDADHNGVVTITEMKQALQKFGYLLSEAEVLVIMKYFDTKQDGQISYNEFCDALLEEDFTTDMMQTKTDLDERYDDEYAARAQTKADQRVETEKVRRAVREISDVVYKQTGTARRLFKELGHMTHLPVATCEQIHAAFMRIGVAFDFEDVRRCVLYVLPESDLNAVNYITFVKTLNAMFHDINASR